MQWFPKSHTSSCRSQNLDVLAVVEILNQHPGLQTAWVPSTATYPPTDRPALSRLRPFPFVWKLKLCFNKILISEWWDSIAKKRIFVWENGLRSYNIHPLLFLVTTVSSNPWSGLNEWRMRRQGSENPLGMCIPPNGTRVHPSRTGNTQLILFRLTMPPSLRIRLRKEQMYTCNWLIPAALDIIVQRFALVPI